ncbi:hypothetical protein VM1G_11884 [Cytospora mali]|uniref:Uncharacterized protein n=1 Tax=Cytospora mali TaxID=578113 RepID=A0A194WAR6_CYTMA|nr:hypothetical protein VM1G_11884 [Valsa mali]
MPSPGSSAPRISADISSLHVSSSTGIETESACNSGFLYSVSLSPWDILLVRSFVRRICHANRQAPTARTATGIPTPSPKYRLFTLTPLEAPLEVSFEVSFKAPVRAPVEAAADDVEVAMTLPLPRETVDTILVLLIEDETVEMNLALSIEAVVPGNWLVQKNTPEESHVQPAPHGQQLFPPPMLPVLLGPQRT